MRKQDFHLMTLSQMINSIKTPVLCTLKEGIFTNQAFNSILAAGNAQPIPAWRVVGGVMEPLPTVAGTEKTIELLDTAGQLRVVQFVHAQYSGSVCLSGHEITHQYFGMQLIKESEARLAQFFNSVGEALFIAEVQGEFFPVLSANAAFLQYFGKEQSAVLGNCVTALVFPGLRSALKAQLQKLMQAENRTGTPLLFELSCMVASAQKYFSVTLVAESSEVDDTMRIFGTITDITTIRRATAELAETRQRAEAFNRLKASLLANLSHEIRTPLNGINGFAQILCEELKDEWYLSVVKRILVSSGRLLSTLNSLIDLSRLEAENLIPNKARIDSTGYLQSLMPGYQELIQLRGLEFYIEFPSYAIVLETDTHLLKSILDKLIDNAIKYTTAGSITFRLTHDSDYAYIQVQDTGIGIGEEHLKTIFEEFWQVTAGMERSHEGLGIGLTLARKMLHLMKGEILVDSTPGAGSTFTVKYPLGVI